MGMKVSKHAKSNAVHMSVCHHLLNFVDQASADDASTVGLMAEDFAQKGWEFAQRQNQRPVKTHSSFAPGPKQRPYSTQVRGPKILLPGARGFSSPAGLDRVGGVAALLMGDVENYPAKMGETLNRLLDFMEEEVYPIERTLMDHQVSHDRWKPHPLIEEVKVSRFNLASLLFSFSFVFV